VIIFPHRWDTVPCNGSMVTHFDVDIDGARTEQVVFDVPAHPALPSAAISGLRPNTDYAIRVRAHNEIGSSAWSSAERVRTTLSPAVLDIQAACFPEKGASKDPYKVCVSSLGGTTMTELRHMMPGIQNPLGAHE